MGASASGGKDPRLHDLRRAPAAAGGLEGEAVAGLDLHLALGGEFDGSSGRSPFGGAPWPGRPRPRRASGQAQGYS